MTTETSPLLRLGAWGQTVVLALGGFFWYFAIPDGMLFTVVGYFGVTIIGILGIFQTESVPAGPYGFAFFVPGHVPLFYLAIRYA